MNLKEMTWPVRIYWDLPLMPPGSIDDLKICEEISEIKILFLSLRSGASPLSPSRLDMFDKLREKKIAVSLTVSSSTLNPSILARLSSACIKTLLIEASSLDELRSSVEKRGQYENAGRLPGVSFDLGKENVGEIPDIVSLCLNNGVPCLAFPIQRLVEERDCFSIKRKEREVLARKLSRIDHHKIQITIHDPFLWKAFYPDTDYHEGGCQAANSMLYISPEYKVYPCPALPVVLGDLQKTTLREIILSGKKRELRTALLDPPEECAACDQARKCLGGCRGRAFASAGSLSQSDPACK